jgi:hypothetical protein
MKPKSLDKCDLSAPIPASVPRYRTILVNPSTPLDHSCKLPKTIEDAFRHLAIRPDGIVPEPKIGEAHAKAGSAKSNLVHPAREGPFTRKRFNNPIAPRCIERGKPQQEAASIAAERSPNVNDASHSTHARLHRHFHLCRSAHGE